MDLEHRCEHRTHVVMGQENMHGHGQAANTWRQYTHGDGSHMCSWSTHVAINQHTCLCTLGQLQPPVPQASPRVKTSLLPKHSAGDGMSLCLCLAPGVTPLTPMSCPGEPLALQVHPWAMGVRSHSLPPSGGPRHLACSPQPCHLFSPFAY